MIVIPILGFCRRALSALLGLRDFGLRFERDLQRFIDLPQSDYEQIAAELWHGRDDAP